MSLNLIKLLLILSIALLVNSCDAFDHLMNPDRWVKRDSPIETVIAPAEIIVSNDTGELGGDIPGVEPKKLIHFTNIGQEYTLKNGEEFKLSYSNSINFAYTTFDVIANDDNSITIKLVDKDTSRVFLKSKCQIIKRQGIDFIPKIEIAKGLDPEQVIITPIFDDNCVKLGYEVRYGSIEKIKGVAGGCREGKKVYNNFKNCLDGKSSPKPLGNGDCSLCRKLGLPCGCTK